MPKYRRFVRDILDTFDEKIAELKRQRKLQDDPRDERAIETALSRLERLRSQTQKCPRVQEFMVPIKPPAKAPAKPPARRPRKRPARPPRRPAR